ncbi:hypothetical protein FO440_17075 [Mucilaginibacter corticis]|uniref:Adenylosuccinate lyase n=1 Tax=Mucilaginibacter corticis TaxID=2597670 RepID=A0A556MHR8_9SPHI|nr:hypothetical protein [Mucilaginibacter corticis]TSJ39456.1 hypothetical protein FO440_17075 [Mucilaginibacter corticis]
MNQAELIKQITATIGKLKVLELGKILHNKNFNLRDLIDITLYPDDAIAFRAAWLLENVFLQYPEVYLPDLDYLLSKINLVKSAGAKRHYAKIVMHITDRRAQEIIKEKVNELDLESTITQLFDWMIDPEIKIAVKAFAAEALFNLRHHYYWITEELANQLQFLMRDGTAAIQSRGKRLLKEL